jgi:hypothetical protein
MSNRDFWPKGVAKQAARERRTRHEWTDLAYALEVLDTLRSNRTRMQCGQDFQPTRALVPLRPHGAIVGQADALGTLENGRPVAFAMRPTSIPHSTRRTRQFPGVRGALRALAPTANDVLRFIVADGPLPPSLRGHAVIWFPEVSDKVQYYFS